MIQPRLLVAVLAFVGVLTTSGIANADGEIVGKYYVEGGVLWANPGDVVADFTDDIDRQNFSLGEMEGLKLQIGGDFGHFRTDFKFRAMYGDIDAISGGVSAISTDTRFAEPAQLAVATVNAYLDIYDIPIAGDAFITPYVGLGGGYGAGFLEIEGTLAGTVRNDHRFDSGTVWSGTVGVLFSINEHLGLSAEYERLNTNVGGFDANSGSVGLRVTF
jgi:hypothetical protein